jgi:exonuclease III
MSAPLISWNCCGAARAAPELHDMAERISPLAIALQETHQSDRNRLPPLPGYVRYADPGTGGKAGVAVYWRGDGAGVEGVETDPEHPGRRLTLVTRAGGAYVCAYVPNSGPEGARLAHRAEYDAALLDHVLGLRARGLRVVLLADLNCCRRAGDYHGNAAGGQPGLLSAEKAALAHFYASTGLVDLGDQVPDPTHPGHAPPPSPWHWTFWSKRRAPGDANYTRRSGPKPNGNGWRLDAISCSPGSPWTSVTTLGGVRISDHSPLVAHAPEDAGGVKKHPAAAWEREMRARTELPGGPGGPAKRVSKMQSYRKNPQESGSDSEEVGRPAPLLAAGGMKARIEAARGVSGDESAPKARKAKKVADGHESEEAMVPDSGEEPEAHHKARGRPPKVPPAGSGDGVAPRKAPKPPPDSDEDGDEPVPLRKAAAPKPPPDSDGEDGDEPVPLHKAGAAAPKPPPDSDDEDEPVALRKPRAASAKPPPPPKGSAADLKARKAANLRKPAEDSDAEPPGTRPDKRAVRPVARPLKPGAILGDSTDDDAPAVRPGGVRGLKGSGVSASRVAGAARRQAPAAASASAAPRAPKHPCRHSDCPKSAMMGDPEVGERAFCRAHCDADVHEDLTYACAHCKEGFGLYYDPEAADKTKKYYCAACKEEIGGLIFGRWRPCRQCKKATAAAKYPEADPDTCAACAKEMGLDTNPRPSAFTFPTVAKRALKQAQGLLSDLVEEIEKLKDGKVPRKEAAGIVDRPAEIRKFIADAEKRLKAAYAIATAA